MKIQKKHPAYHHSEQEHNLSFSKECIDKTFKIQKKVAQIIIFI